MQVLFYYLSVIFCITGVISLGKCAWIPVTSPTNHHLFVIITSPIIRSTFVINNLIT